MVTRCTPEPLEECKQVWYDIKKEHMYRYAILVIVGDISRQYLKVEKKGQRENTLDDLLDDLPPCDCRYVLYDFDFVDENGKLKNIPLYIAWVPKTSRVRIRMLYEPVMQLTSRSFQENGIPLLSINATSSSDIEEKEIQIKCASFIQKPDGNRK